MISTKGHKANSIFVAVAGAITCYLVWQISSYDASEAFFCGFIAIVIIVSLVSLPNKDKPYFGIHQKKE